MVFAKTVHSLAKLRTWGGDAVSRVAILSKSYRQI